MQDITIGPKDPFTPFAPQAQVLTDGDKASYLCDNCILFWFKGAMIDVGLQLIFPSAISSNRSVLGKSRFT